MIAMTAFSRRQFVCAACALLAAPGAPAQLLPQGFDPARNPEKDLAAALQVARATGRRVLVEVGGEWCSWCHILDRFFANEPELRRYRDAHYVWLNVNFSKENPNEGFLRRWPKVAGYPHFFVLDADGRLLVSQDTAPLETLKSYDPVAMRAFLARWALPGRV